MRFDKKELIKMLEERIEILERSALELNNPRMRKELRDLARDFRVEVERIQQEINKSCGRIPRPQDFGRGK